MVAVLGVPFDDNSSFLKGASAAPTAIRKAFHSDSANYFTESGVDLKNHPQVLDEGDVVFTPATHFSLAIEERVRTIASRDHRVFGLGGDHSITFPIVNALSEHTKDITIVHLDAHPDLYDNFDDNPYSHASPFARILEKGAAKRLIQAGIRTMNTHQRAQARKFGVEVVEMKDWKDAYRFKLDGPVYLSLDIDAIDPAFAPGVSHHEPGGFTTRQILSILQNLPGNLVGADLVEFNPSRDSSGITAMLAAKLYKEILDVFLR